MNQLNGQDVTDSERASYDTNKSKIEELSEKIRVIERDKSTLEQIKKTPLIKESFDLEMTGMSEIGRGSVSQLLSSLIAETEKKWNIGIDRIISELNTKAESYKNEINSILQNPNYIKVSSLYKQSNQLAEIEKNIETQKKKLLEVQQLEKEVEEIKKQIGQNKDKALTPHNSYH